MTVTYKTADLIGWRLDLAVAFAEGVSRYSFTGHMDDSGSVFVAFDDGVDVDGRTRSVSLTQYHPSRDWFDGGPIIEREGIPLAPDPSMGWAAGEFATESVDCPGAWGPTPLVAAMRAFLQAHVGATVELLA